MIDFTSPKVKRGRFTNYRTHAFVEFLYNPTTIKEKPGVNLSSDDIPGASDPLLRFASGKGRPIAFDVQLCGESSLRRRGSNMINAAHNEDAVNGDGGYSIAAEIEFFEQFTYPTDPALGGTGAPDLVVFTFGRRYRGILCTMEDLDIDVFEFDPDLNPTRANLSVSLKRYVTRTIFSNEIYLPFGAS